MWLAPTTTVGPETAAEMPKSLESAVTEPGSRRRSFGPRLDGLLAARGAQVSRPARRDLGLVKPGARMPDQVIAPAGFFERLARAGLPAGPGFAAMVDIW